MPKSKGGAALRPTRKKEMRPRRQGLPEESVAAADYGERHEVDGACSRGSALTCQVIRSDAAQVGKQGLTCFVGISAKSAGAKSICMHLQTIPPGGRAQAHFHAKHETAIYVLSGTAEMWYGGELCQHLVVHAGDFLYIPAGMPHLPANSSSTEPCIAVIARTDPNEQESVVLLPEREASA
jgi:uncharacterized RmlC-like cupin family protein